MKGLGWTIFFDFVLIPLCLPFILLWILISTLISILSPFTIVLPIVLSKQLYWALPIGPIIWKSRGIFQKIGFEATYCMNITRRFLTLPLRRYTPDFYILGFPKCGTTTLASYIQAHPAICGIDGMPWDPVFSKESHFFNGVLGRGKKAYSKSYYRSFFPTILTRWWRERIRRAGHFMCFDACPLTGCLPFTAKRVAAINPSAKLIFMVRDPVDAVFSVEMMLRNIGMELEWSFMEDVVAADPRFAQSNDDAKFWDSLEKMDIHDDLPVDLPQRLYSRCSSLLKCASYADRVQPFIKLFPRENILFIEYSEFVAYPDKIIDQVLTFVGADTSKYTFKPLPLVSGARNGRRIHPAVRRKLQNYFSERNQQLFAITGQEYAWNETPAVDEEEGGGNKLATIPVFIQEKVSNAARKAADLLPGHVYLHATTDASIMSPTSLQRNQSHLIKRTASLRK